MFSRRRTNVLFARVVMAIVSSLPALASNRAALTSVSGLGGITLTATHTDGS